MTKSSTKTGAGGSVHQSIFDASAKEEPTMRQCSYLVFLYKEVLRSKILKRHDHIAKAKTSDFPYFQGVNRKPSSFAIHLLNTFTVAENMNRGDISKLIDDAKSNNNFSVAFVRKFLDSANQYYADRAKSV